MSSQLHFLIAVSVWSRLRRLGGVGLILLALADNPVIPLPGSMDVLTILLAARHPELWWYYAFMATVGAIIGGYITYGLARKGGKEAFERKVSKKTAGKVFKRVERWGFFAVAVPALLPPPFPIVPFLLAAGALQYSRRKFVAALALGRRHPLHHPGRTGSDLWPAHRPVLLAILHAGIDYAGCAGCDRRSSLSHSILSLQEQDGHGLGSVFLSGAEGSLCLIRRRRIFCWDIAKSTQAVPDGRGPSTAQLLRERSSHSAQDDKWLETKS